MNKYSYELYWDAVEDADDKGVHVSGDMRTEYDNCNWHIAQGAQNPEFFKVVEHYEIRTGKRK